MHESGCPNRKTSLVMYIPKQGCVNTTKKCGVKNWVKKLVEFVAPFLAWKHEAKTAATKTTYLFTNLFTTRLCNGFTLSHQIFHAFSTTCFTTPSHNHAHSVFSLSGCSTRTLQMFAGVAPIQPILLQSKNGRESAKKGTYRALVPAKKSGTR